MLLIACPHCGERPEIEFRCGGEAHIARSADPGAIDDAAWAGFLFYRTNPKGVHAERWLHAHGCQRWFNALRDTVSDRILATYAMGAPRPEVPSPLVGVPSPLWGGARGGGNHDAAGVPPSLSLPHKGGGEAPQGGGAAC